MNRRFRFLVFLFGLAAWLSPARAAEAVAGFVLEIEAAAPAGGAAQLFYDIGQWYSVRDSARVEIPAGAMLRTYRFAIPPQPIRRLRFDPADGAATVRFGAMRLLTAAGTELARFGPERLVPMHAIESLRVENGVASVVTGADDPMLLIAQPLQQVTAQALGRRPVGHAGLLALATVVGLLMGTALAAAVRAVAREAGARWFLLGAFLVVAGARLQTLKLFSRPMPFWDDWKTGAIDLAIPWRGGWLDWPTLFLPHGEHRILVTRLITLGGSILNGEWDPRVAMTAGALMFAAAIALCATLLARRGGRVGVVAALVLLAWGALPFDARNVTWGDQSQMYALVLFGVLVLAIATSERVGRLAVAGGLAAGAVSLFTMGSGFVAPAIGAAICFFRARGEPENRRGLVALAGVFATATFAGLLLYRAAPFQGAAYARTWAEFWPAFVNRAAWPLPPRVWSVVGVWLPWGALVLALLARRRGNALDWLAFGLGAWALVNVLGLAHGRPAEAPPFDSKYYTAMSQTVVAALLSAAALTQHTAPRRWLAVLASVAAVAATLPMFFHGRTGIEAARNQLSDRQANDALVRPFLATGDPMRLRATPWHQLPYWNGAELADLLETPELQPWLPAVLRAAAAQRPGSALRGPQAPGPLTLGARTLMKAGWFCCSLGGVLVLGLAVRWLALGARQNPARHRAGPGATSR